MGRFRCVRCQCTYHSKRFFWEDDEDEEVKQSEQDTPPKQTQTLLTKGSLQQHTSFPSDIGECSTRDTLPLVSEVSSPECVEVREFSLGSDCGSEANSSKHYGVSELNDFLGEVPACDASTESDEIDTEIDTSRYGCATIYVHISRDSSGSAGFRFFAASMQISHIDEDRLDLCNMRLGDTITAVNGVPIADESGYVRHSMDVPDFTLTLDRAEQSKQSKWISRQSLARNADVMRASGTTANILGTAAPVLHFAMAPVSAVAGAVGAVSGATQLYSGLSTPSGAVDPHLVTKGAVTTGVGATCAGLGLLASVFPPLFAVALGLGVTGLAAATTIDALMDGLCDECREQTTPQSLEDFLAMPAVPPLPAPCALTADAHDNANDVAIEGTSAN
jgi:hypothetical protein